jgi:hypothetical protein
MLLSQSHELGLEIASESGITLNLKSIVGGTSCEIENFIIKNRTSKHLPFVCNFISYWENNIICYYDCSETDGEEQEQEEYELEVDELLMLFNKSIKKSATTLLHNNASDKMLLGLIRHFYPDVIIEDDKYLIQVGIKSEIWNKQKEIEEFNEYYKLLKHSQTPQPVNSSSVISHSLYSMYQSYCKYAFEKRYNVISKRWFEKYFISKYDMFLIDNAIVSSKWFQL